MIPAERIRCIFSNPDLIAMVFGSKRLDESRCVGQMSQHHVHYKCEGGLGTPTNLVPMCRNHQNYIHSKEEEWARRENGDSQNGAAHDKLALQEVLR